MFLAASKARLWSPDPKSSLDTWADEQGEAAYLDLEERYARHPNALLRGDMADLLNHSLKIWPPKRFPTLYQPIPPDLRNPIHWDGKVLGGQEVPTTARRHLSPEVYSAAVSAASKNARILTKWIRTVLLVPGVGLALLYAATVFSAGVGFPKWAAAAGFYGPVFGWYLSLIIDTAVLGGLAAGLALLASRLAFRPFVLFGQTGSWSASSIASKRRSYCRVATPSWSMRKRRPNGTRSISPTRGKCAQPTTSGDL